jgi:hypothetical protein
MAVLPTMLEGTIKGCIDHLLYCASQAAISGFAAGLCRFAQPHNPLLLTF